MDEVYFRLARVQAREKIQINKSKSLPVMIASSRIVCLHIWQLYEQFSQTGRPSVNNNKFDSQSTALEHFAQTKL